MLSLFLAFQEHGNLASAQCLLCGEEGFLTNPDGFIRTQFVEATCLTIQNNPNLLPAGFCEIFQTSSAVADTCGCINPTQSCPVCGPDGTLTNPGGIITFRGISGTCELINNNQRVFRTFEQCLDFQRSSLISAACGCVDPIQFCPVCGGGTITNPSGLINTPDVFGTCEVVNNNQRTIPDCSEIQENAAVATNCTCVNDPVQSCPVCGSGTLTNPDGLIETDRLKGKCGVINENQRVIPADFCPTVQVSSQIAGACGCIESPTSCPLCGENGILTKPDADLTEGGVAGTCQVLNDNPRVLPPFSCPVFQRLAQENDRCGCRGRTPTSAPGRLPTPMGGGILQQIFDYIRDFFSGIGRSA